MMKRPTKKHVIGSIFLLLLIFQFFRIDKTVPSYDAEGDFLAIHNEDPTMSQLIRDACYDCHSYESTYPWYSEIAPLSWWIKGHINGGRKHLNFSIWSTFSQKKQHHKMEECVEKVENEFMPLKSFTWAHPEARLSDLERKAMIAYFNQKEVDLR